MNRNQNTFSADWCGCEMNFKAVVYTTEHDHRSKRNGRTQNLTMMVSLGSNNSDFEVI